jgi:hypothetical protein
MNPRMNVRYVKLHNGLSMHAWKCRPRLLSRRLQRAWCNLPRGKAGSIGCVSAAAISIEVIILLPSVRYARHCKALLCRASTLPGARGKRMKIKNKMVNGINVEQLFRTIELVTMAQKYSPVFNTITKSAPVIVQLEK